MSDSRLAKISKALGKVVAFLLVFLGAACITAAGITCMEPVMNNRIPPVETSFLFIVLAAGLGSATAGSALAILALGCSARYSWVTVSFCVAGFVGGVAHEVVRYSEGYALIATGVVILVPTIIVTRLIERSEARLRRQ